jgi:uncharacterized membrane protein
VGLLLPIHIFAAAVGIVSGGVALSAAKGGSIHRRSGKVFVCAMLVMCVSAAVMAAFRGQTMNVIAGLMTAYLVITALLTVRRGSAPARRLDVGLMFVALALGLTAATFGVEALTSATGKKFGLPAFPFFMFGIVGLLGAAGDVRMIRKGRLQGAPRLTRHLWRMCWALWIATISFFSIRARVARILPEPFLSAPMRALPPLLVVVVMLYWLVRIRFKRAYRGMRLFDAPSPSSTRA